jgi:hypothetical protein
MQVIKHTVGLINMNSVDDLVNTLNSLEETKCTIVEKNITSVTLSIQISNDCTLEDVLSLGSLIGTIQTSRLC